MVSVPSRRFRLFLLSVVGLFWAIVPGAFAQVFFSDFNSGVPAGASLPAGPAADPNEARVDAGYLKLTDNLNSACGFFYVNDFSGGVPVKQFVATFKASLFGGGARPADGFSFNLVPAATLNPSPVYIASEVGLSEGLSVTFDSWDATAPNADGPNIKVKWLGTQIGVADIQPSTQTAAGAITAEQAAKEVQISLREDGKIDVLYGGQVAFAGLQTPYDAAVVGAPAWVLTARTGGANDNHWIDDLRIVTAPISQLAIAPAGSVWAFNDATLSPGLTGTGWELPAYDTNSVPGWKSGPALFGNDSAGVYDALGQPFAGRGTGGFETPLDRTGGRVTFYFRTKFNYSGSTAGVTLTSSNWVDDGLRAFLNGVEVSRIRVPAAPTELTWDTLGENPPTEGAVEVRTWDASALVEGENTVAVEVHQSSTGSSDVAFALSLSVTGPLAPVITDLFEPSDRVIFANRMTTLTVTAMGSPAPSYQWFKDGSEIPGATSASYTIVQMSEADAGDYFCRVSNALGSADSRTATVGYLFDETPPQIVSVVGSGSFDSITVSYDELVEEQSATDEFAYEITDSVGNTLTVIAGSLNANGSSVTLMTDPQTPDTVYTVRVSGVLDAAGNEIPFEAPSVATFRSWVSGPGNGVLFETFDTPGRSTIDNLLTSQPNFPNNPRERFLISGFNSRLAYPDDSHEDYAGRLRGLFIPPVSGNWIFHMSSDDPGRLFINPTGPSAAGKIVVGNQPGCCNPFPATGAQLSQPYPLEAGQGYYVELVYWEYGGGDYGQVAVQLQGTPGPTGPNLIDSLVGSGAAPAGVGGPLEITQQPASATVLANAIASFTVAASNPNGLPIAYQWRRDGVDIPGATLPSYSFGPVSVGADNGAVFDCLVSVIGTSTVSAQATLTVEEDTTKPTIVSVRGAADLTRVVVRYSEFLDVNTATDEFNYTIAGSINPQSVSLSADGMTVTLQLDAPLTPDTQYTLHVELVADLSGNEVDPVDISFTTFGIRPGFALTEIYQNIAGVTVADLTGNEKYPASPDLVRYKGLLELNTFDEFENYGARMSGWITPPVSGSYNFFMSSDDGGALFLSTDANPANLVLVAQEPVWNGRRDWQGTTRRNPDAPENRSATLFPGGIELTAGQSYYFEALVKEGGGGDNLAVAWQMPGAAAPANGSTPISGIYMSSLVDPTGASLEITQQPADQVFVIASDTLLNELFDSGGGGFTVDTPPAEAFSAPWTHNAGSGSWQVVQDGAEVGHPMTSRLVSPTLTVTKAGAVVLNFDHRYSFEDGLWDGGQVQISVNGGAFAAVPASAFTQNGYAGNLLPNSSSVLAGQPTFNLTSANFATGLITSIATLGTFSPGDTIVIRFVYAGDTNTRGPNIPNWEVGRVAVNQGAQGAQALTFATAINAAGPNASTVFYQWFRDNGSGFQPIPDANGASYSLVPVLADNGAKFRVQIYIPGANVTSDTATLTVVQPNTPPRFTAGPNQSVPEDSGPQSVPGWASDIIPHSVDRTPIVYGSDFAALPAGSVVGGNARVDAGILKLTDAVNSQTGSFATPSVPNRIDSFTAEFDALIGGGTCCGDRTADGWSFSFGDIAVPVTFPAAAEEGAGTDLIVSFDSWDNAGFGDDDAYTAPNVDVKSRGPVVAYQAFDGVREGGRAPSGPFITDPATGGPMSYKTGTEFAHVRVHLDPDGTLDLDFKGVRIFDNVQVGPRQLVNARIAFGARTGGANDNHWIDNLMITAFPVDSSSGEAGQTVSFLVSNDNPSLFSAQPSVSPDGTLSYTPAPNANGVATVTVRAMDNGGSAFGGNDTSAAQTFTITLTPVNDCPTLASVPPLTVDAGGSGGGQLAGADVDGDILTYAIVGPPSHGVATVVIGTGAFTYTPTAGYSGPDSFQVVANDGTCNSGVVTVAITVREVNRCPTAVADVNPNIELAPGQVETIILSSNNTNACMTLDGSLSSDPDGDSLTYTWVVVLSDGTTMPLASGATASACLDVGSYTVRLVVDDGKCINSADVPVEIITVGEAIDELINKVNDSTIDRKNKRPFIASLKAAVASFDRGSCQSGANQLKAFINKVRAQISRNNPDVAAELTALANAILAQVDCPEDEE